MADIPAVPVIGIIRSAIEICTESVFKEVSIVIGCQIVDCHREHRNRDITGALLGGVSSESPS